MATISTATTSPNPRYALLDLYKAASNLGIGAGTLRYWIRKDRQRRGADSEAETLRIQLVEAQRQINRLTEERDILKKATAYFAREQP